MYCNTGIYNGALGTVVKFGYRGGYPKNNKAPKDLAKAHREIPIVYVRLDATINFSILPNIPNVIPVVAQSTYMENKISRIQVPLLPAHAVTVHSCQGMTAKHGIVLLPSEGKPFAHSLEYVGCSRPRSLDQLYILKNPLQTTHFTSHGDVYKKIENEYVRLRNIN